MAELAQHVRSSYDSPLAMFRAMAGTQSGGAVHRLAFLRACRGLALPLDADTAEFAFDGLDADQDGEVTSAEFLGTFFLQHLFQSPEAIEAVGAFSDATAAAAAPPPAAVVSDAPDAPAPAAARSPWQPPLTFESFRARIQEPVPVVFARMDRNGNGFASHAEFLEWSRSCSPPLSQTEAEYAFLGLDENHDRFLSAPELGNAMSASTFFPGEVAKS